MRSFFNVWIFFFFFGVLESQHNNSLTETKVAQQRWEKPTHSVCERKEREREKKLPEVFYLFFCPDKYWLLEMSERLRFFWLSKQSARDCFSLWTKKSQNPIDRHRLRKNRPIIPTVWPSDEWLSSLVSPLVARRKWLCSIYFGQFPCFPCDHCWRPWLPRPPLFVLRRLVDVAFDVAAAYCKGYIANVLWVAACVPTRWNKREVQRGSVMDK